MVKYYIDQLYWALETGFLNLTATVPVPIDAADIHQAFNPCHGDIEIPKPVNKDKIEYTSDSVLPNHAVSYTEEITPGRGRFPNGNGMDYRDPFLKECIFTHKTATGTWDGGAATYGKLTGDFSAFDDISSIMLQYGMTDGITPINRCLNGVFLSEYALGFKAGAVLKEFARLESAFVSPNTQAFVPAASFDDGQWADWAKATVYHATDCKVFWDDAHAAEFAGLKIQEFEMKILAPRSLEKIGKNLYYTEEWYNNLKFEATVKGILTGDTEFLELEKLFSAKAKKDLRLQWDSTANELKWLQFDDAFIRQSDSYSIPARANARKINLTLEGGSAQFEGNYEDLVDPSTRIDLSP